MSVLHWGSIKVLPSHVITCRFTVPTLNEFFCWLFHTMGNLGGTVVYREGQKFYISEGPFQFYAYGVKSMLNCFLLESEMRRLIPIACLCIKYGAGVRTWLASLAPSWSLKIHPQLTS